MDCGFCIWGNHLVVNIDMTVKHKDINKPDKLEVKYINLDDARLFDRNSKKHDIGALIQSFKKHGYKSIPKWENRLNNGRGGIVAGNGRIEALLAMKKDGQHPPRGIVARNGHWLVPVAFGVNAETEKAAISFAIDDNNLTMSGGDFDHFEISKMWDFDGYLALLQDADKDFLVSMEQEDIDALVHAGTIPSGNKPIDEDAMKETEHECPKCGFKW